MLNTGKSDSSTSKSIVEEVDRKERSQKESHILRRPTADSIAVLYTYHSKLWEPMLVFHQLPDD